MWIGSKASGKYLALSLVKLYNQINELVPGRGRGVDGSIGDEAHQASVSDHNPNSAGVVRAMDITHDPSGGFDSYAFAEHLRQTRDPRILNVISNGRIWSSQVSPFVWRNRDKGAGDHTQHVHISVVTNPALYDDLRPWNVTFSPFPGTPPTPPQEPKLRRGSIGPNVVRLQKLLGIKDDGIFGPMTEATVRQFQTRNGLHSDGIVGVYTWDMLKTHPPVLSARKVLFQTAGKMSTFGGPQDGGVAPAEGLALFTSDIQMIAAGLSSYLLTEQQAGAPGLARRLNPKKFYIACRWNTDDYPDLRDAVAHVSANGKTFEARPVDWGPNVNTGRAADLSPGLAEALGLETDDECTVVVYEDGK